MSLGEGLGRRFARVATAAVSRRPEAWRLFRRGIALQFDRLAPVWDARRDPAHLAPLEAALAAVDPPRRALDVGTGTGAAALTIARKFAGAEVVGVDLSRRMIVEARRRLPADLAGRVRFECADAARLPFDGGSFELVALANMIPFFDEIARVTAPGGAAVFAFSSGSETPIYVPFRRLRSELERRGFTRFDEFAAGRGTALLARKPDPA